MGYLLQETRTMLNHCSWHSTATAVRKYHPSSARWPGDMMPTCHVQPPQLLLMLIRQQLAESCAMLTPTHTISGTNRSCC